MEAKGNRVHHVVGLVRPENFATTIARMEQVLATSFYPPVQRPEFGIQMAISLDAGIELIAPISPVAEHPLVQSIEAMGERWLSVVMATDDLDAACTRLERLGCTSPSRQSLMDLEQPFADRISRFDQATADPAAFGGLPVILAEIEQRAR